MLRLSQVDAFPAEHRAAVRAVVAALVARGCNAIEYLADISTSDEGFLQVHLRHESHPADGSWRGDPCGRCRIAWCDPKTGTVSRFQGIR
jgi:hypothetical protein